MYDKSFIFLETASFLSGSLLSITADSCSISFAFVNVSCNEKTVIVYVSENITITVLKLNSIVLIV